MDAQDFLKQGKDLTDGTNGKERDVVLGMAFLKKAADLVDTEAMRKYGIGLEKGFLGERDLVGSMEWYKKSADLGDTDGMRNYGLGLDK
jgi:TPR repeat protein